MDSFPGQSIDFFGALRARVYDEKVRDFVTQLGVENLSKRLINSREGKVTFEKPRMTLDVLMKFGKALVQEQVRCGRHVPCHAQRRGADSRRRSLPALLSRDDGPQENVKRVQLADEYLSGAALAGVDGSSLPEEYEGSKGLSASAAPKRRSLLS